MKSNVKIQTPNCSSNITSISFYEKDNQFYAALFFSNEKDRTSIATLLRSYEREFFYDAPQSLKFTRDRSKEEALSLVYTGDLIEIRSFLLDEESRILTGVGATTLENKDGDESELEELLARSSKNHLDSAKTSPKNSDASSSPPASPRLTT